MAFDPLRRELFVSGVTMGHDGTLYVVDINNDRSIA
ncbi:MAG: hypothetical protein BWY83_00022 [bacterium ADurb.Bin478]|nr:MAG: hypothetical protein BWY83_00022 [bacterium ADurb.Bin478]